MQQRIHRGRLLRALYLTDKIPATRSGRWDDVPVYNYSLSPLPWAHFTVYLTRSRGRSKHRLFVVCACGRNIPFGRIHQHSKACKAFRRKYAQARTN